MRKDESAIRIYSWLLPYGLLLYSIRNERLLTDITAICANRIRELCHRLPR